MDKSPAALESLLRGRRSVRRFLPQKPPRAMIERILEAATAAPSASNKQPWRFLVVSDRARIERLASRVREAVERVARHVEPAYEASFRAYGDYFTRFEAAPLVIVPLYRSLTVLSNMAGSGLEERDRRSIALMEENSGLIGASMAAQNLLLMAHALGLGASGMTGPLLALDAVRESLEVPESWQVLALIPVGYPAEEPPPTARKPLDAVARWIE